jgi:hypothetical protein
MLRPVRFGAGRARKDAEGRCAKVQEGLRSVAADATGRNRRAVANCLRSTPAAIAHCAARGLGAVAIFAQLPSQGCAIACRGTRARRCAALGRASSLRGRQLERTAWPRLARQ